MKRRILAIAACAAVLALAPASGASAGQVMTAKQQSTWTCVALKGVAGACVENPGQDITDAGGVVGIVDDIV